MLDKHRYTQIVATVIVDSAGILAPCSWLTRVRIAHSCHEPGLTSTMLSAANAGGAKSSGTWCRTRADGSGLTRRAQGRTATNGGASQCSHVGGASQPTTLCFCDRVPSGFILRSTGRGYLLFRAQCSPSNVSWLRRFMPTEAKMSTCVACPPSAKTRTQPHQMLYPSHSGFQLRRRYRTLEPGTTLRVELSVVSCNGIIPSGGAFVVGLGCAP